MLLKYITDKMPQQQSIEQMLVRIFHILLIVTIICLIVPFSPNMPTGGLDPSWKFGMNQALAQGLAIGRDVIFTFGPYVSIYTKTYHPATDHLMLYGSIYIALSYGLAIFLLVEKSGWFLVAIFSLFLIVSFVFFDPLYFSYPLIVGVLCLKYNSNSEKNKIHRNQTLAELIILLIPFGLLPLIKGSFLMLCAVTVVIISASFVLRRKWRRLGVVIFVPIVSSFVFWIFSGQPAAGLFSYLISITPIISGYTSAMAADGVNMEIYFYLVAAIVLLLVISIDKSLMSAEKILTILVFSAYLFIAFKGGFVRHDGHAQIAGIAIVLATFIAAFIFNPKYITIAFVFSLGSWAYIDQNYSGTSTRELFGRLNSTYKSAFKGMQDRLSGSKKLESSFDSAIIGLNNQEKIQILKGTTDIYSYNQSFLIASGNIWNPRPIFQSYSAYTPSLAKKNKEHLVGSSAPDNVIFRVEPIDDRLPPIEDGASWPTLLSNYEPEKIENGFLYLHRILGGVQSKEITLRSGIYSFGETVHLQNEYAPTYVEILIKPSFFGRLVNVFYKPSKLQISLTLKNGMTASYSLVPGMAASGFVISPLINNSDDFGLLYGGVGYLEEKLVKSFSISHFGNSSQWENKYEVVFKRLDLSKAIDVSKIFDFDALILNGNKKIISLADKCDGNIDFINGFSPADKSTVNSFIKVRGWLAKSAEEGTIGDLVLLVLRDSTGKNLFINTRLSPRPDVGVFFKKPQLESAGFVSMADVAAIRGDYNLGLAYVDGSHIKICPQFSIPITLKGGAR